MKINSTILNRKNNAGYNQCEDEDPVLVKGLVSQESQAKRTNRIGAVQAHNCTVNFNFNFNFIPSTSICLVCFQRALKPSSALGS